MEDQFPWEYFLICAGFGGCSGVILGFQLFGVMNFEQEVFYKICAAIFILGVLIFFWRCERYKR